MEIPIQYYLIIAAVLFALGLATVITRKNLIMMLMGIELMLNATNINLVAFSYYDPEKLQGQMLTLFVMIVAAAEVTVALAIIIRVYHHYKTTEPQKINSLKD